MGNGKDARQGMEEMIANYGKGITIEKAGLAGLSKRELFAAMAMQGILSQTPRTDLHFEVIVKQAVLCAEAFIAELNYDRVPMYRNPGLDK